MNLVRQPRDRQVLLHLGASYSLLSFLLRFISSRHPPALSFYGMPMAISHHFHPLSKENLFFVFPWSLRGSRFRLSHHFELLLLESVYNSRDNRLRWVHPPSIHLPVLLFLQRCGKIRSNWIDTWTLCNWRNNVFFADGIKQPEDRASMLLLRSVIVT